MKKGIILIIITFTICTSTYIFGQNQKKIDSLIGVLDKSNKDTAVVSIYNQLFSEYINKDTVKAMEYFQKAVKLSKKSDYQEGLANSYNIYSRYCNQTGQYYTALNYSKRALKIYNYILKSNTIDHIDVEAKIGTAMSFSNIGLTYDLQGDYDNAVIYYKNSLAIYEHYGQKYGIANCYSNMGCVNIAKGNYPEALEYFQQSLKLSKEINNKTEIASCYNNLGVIYENMGKYPEAINSYIKALKIYEQKDNKNGTGACLINIAILQDLLGNSSVALDYTEKAHDALAQIGDQSGVAYCYNTIANIKTKQLSYNEAINYYNKATVILEKIGDRFGLACTINNMGIAYEKSGKLEKALECYQKSLAIKNEIGEKAGTASTYGNIAGLYITMGRFNEGINFAHQSIEIAKKTGLISEEMDAYYHLYNAYRKLNNTGLALDNYILYTEFKDSLFSVEKNKQLTEMEVRYQSEKRQIMIEELEKEKVLQNEIIIRKESETRKQKIIIYTFIAGFIIILAFAIIIYRLFIMKKRANVMILEKNSALLSANEEISSQRDEIEAQRDEISAQRDIVVIQKNHIEEQKKAITDSINYAKRIQQAVLPDLSPALFKGEGINHSLWGELGGAFILFKPKDIVSGDFYWATQTRGHAPLTTRGHAPLLIVAVADCTGHGVPGAFMSMLGVSFLNEIVRKKEITKASEILDHMRESVIEALQQKGQIGEQTDGMDIALCVLNTTNNKLQFAGANNSLFIVTPQKELKEIKPDKQPISIYKNMKPYTNHEIQLYEGDCIFLLSDGYEDQFGGPKNKKFMAKQLKELFVDIADKPMNEQNEILDKTLKNWIGEHEQIDDITILGIKI